MASEENVVLKTQGLFKEYKSGPVFFQKTIPAVVDLDLEVRRGEVFGFLGPNGAGKTTTLHMLAGISRPSAGAIEIFGRSFRCGQIWPLHRIGYVPESTYLPGDMTMTELLSFFARLYGLPGTTVRERISRMFEMIGFVLRERATFVRSLSMGQRRLLDLVLALVHDPDLVFFDEPTVYLDPLAVERFRDIVGMLKKKGKTVFLSSHTLPLIERLSDRVAVIARGRLLRVAPAQDFAAEGGLETVFLQLVKGGA
ncbi:MAG: ABC transporter ATP-binding protein [Candidatus Omnitrophica bacterium]|nr:ABC transporter ATP-binding protein [Candidatus Omnitrophota bacterium]